MALCCCCLSARSNRDLACLCMCRPPPAPPHFISISSDEMIHTAVRMNALQRMARPRTQQLGSQSLLARAPSAVGVSAATAAARRTLFTRKTPAQRLKGRLWTGAGLVLGGLFAVYAYDSSAGVHRCVRNPSMTGEAGAFRLSTSGQRTTLSDAHYTSAL